MSERIDQDKLQDGTLIRHKVMGYEGRIDGTTEIKSCFTSGGKAMERPSTGQAFQYRVFVEGESLRRIAPSQDLEILDGVVDIVCLSCHSSFRTKPGLADKPGGRCQCGAWICPSCLACRSTGEETAKGKQSACSMEKKRLLRKSSAKKKKKK